MDEAERLAIELALADAAARLMDRTGAESPADLAAAEGTALAELLAREAGLPVGRVAEVVETWEANAPTQDAAALLDSTKRALLLRFKELDGEPLTEEEQRWLDEHDPDLLRRQLRAEGVPVNDPRQDEVIRQRLTRKLEELLGDEGDD